MVRQQSLKLCESYVGSTPTLPAMRYNYGCMKTPSKFHKRYNWGKIQEDVKSGLRLSDIHKKYGVYDTAWYLAISRGDLVVPDLIPPKKKRCTMCGRSRLLKSFHIKNKKTGSRNCYCKDCQSKYVAGHYSRNRAAYAKRTRKNSEAAKVRTYKFLLQYFEAHPCVDCGETNPIKLQFDHVRGKKRMNISQLVGMGYSVKRLEEEISKCEIRCANCHLVKTANERNWRWVKILASHSRVVQWEDATL